MSPVYERVLVSEIPLGVDPDSTILVSLSPVYPNVLVIVPEGRV